MNWEYQAEYAKLLDQLDKDVKPWIDVSKSPVPTDGSTVYFKLSENWEGKLQYDVGEYQDYTKEWWYSEGDLDGEFNTEFGNLDYEILAWKYVEAEK